MGFARTPPPPRNVLRARPADALTERAQLRWDGAAHVPLGTVATRESPRKASGSCADDDCAVRLRRASNASTCESAGVVSSDTAGEEGTSGDRCCGYSGNDALCALLCEGAAAAAAFGLDDEWLERHLLEGLDDDDVDSTNDSTNDSETSDSEMLC
jgi:hypothetical protein